MHVFLHNLFVNFNVNKDKPAQTGENGVSKVIAINNIRKRKEIEFARLKI